MMFLRNMGNGEMVFFFYPHVVPPERGRLNLKMHTHKTSLWNLHRDLIVPEGHAVGRKIIIGTQRSSGTLYVVNPDEQIVAKIT